MVTMTKSFSYWCLTYHSELYSPLMFGHTELLTKELAKEYFEWCLTDEAIPYLNEKNGE